MALVASDALVVPLQTEFFALEGLTQLLKKMVQSCLKNTTGII